MKIWLNAAALLLGSATPALSADFIYLKCTSQMTVESTGIKEGKEVRSTEKKSDISFFKIDTIGGRFASYNSSSTQGKLKWDEATITQDKLSATMSEKNELMEANGVLNIELQPPGQLTSQLSAVAFGMMTTEIDVIGDCEAIEESTFEEGRTKP